MKRSLILPMFCFLAIGCANQQTLARRVNSAVTLYVGVGGPAKDIPEPAAQVVAVASLIKLGAGDITDQESIRAILLETVKNKYRDDPEKQARGVVIVTVLFNEIEISLPPFDLPDALDQTRKLVLLVCDEAIKAAEVFRSVT